MKIANDKYYTPVELADYCISKAFEIIGEENITEMVESSVGSGSFLYNTHKPDFAYDIEPECDDRLNGYTKVIKGDFLNSKISYRRGRLVIGNPPYGRCLNLAQKFYKKSVEVGDYIAFILPISQLNNTYFLYEFDLIYSEDLGEQLYTDRKLHCCFNIYSRPENGLNLKVSPKLRDITIYRQDSKGYNERDFDIRMCYWGDGSAGKILKDNEHYSAEYKIKVNNPELREDVVRVLTEFDWQSYLNCISMRKIHQFHIIEILRKNISSIK